MNKDFNNDTRIYNGSKQGIIMITVTLIVLLGYIFFFSTGYFFKDTSAATEVNEPINYDEDTRTATLLEAEYSPNQNLMEIKIQLGSTNFDGIDKYYFDADVLRGRKSNLKIKEVLHTEILTVVQITGVKSQYRELTLFFAPKLKNVAEKNMCKIVINNSNCKTVNRIVTKTTAAYLADRLDLTIEKLKSQLKANKERLGVIHKLISKITHKNVELEKSKLYLTASESEQISETIATNKGQIQTLQSEAKELESSNEDISKQITDAIEKKAEIGRM